MPVVPSSSQRKSLEEALVRFEANLDLAKDYLVGRGFTHATCRAFRLGVTDREDSKWPAGRLAIPYLAHAGIVDIKFRSISREDGSATPKYLYASGTEHRLFNAQALARRSGTYVVTEGELDAISVEQACGQPTVSYPGASAWKPYFGRAFYGCAEVVVLADGDDPGRKAARAVSKEIGKFAEAVRIVELGDGLDANAILVQEGPDKLREVIGV